MERILVLRGGALGDFIVTLPTLAALRRQWPAARIELAGNVTAAALALRRGLLDAVHSQHEARWSALFGSAPLPAALTEYLASFDLVLSYWPDPEGELRRRFPQRAGQTFLSAPALPERGPAAAHYAAVLRQLGVPPVDPLYRLAPLTPAAGPRAGIAVHPGSGSPRKNWPAAHWQALVRELPDATLALGEAERQGWNAFSASGVRVLADATLEELVALFTRSRLFLGHDSGVSHLAAACGTPCVLLFGPTDPTVWAPPAPWVRVLQRGPDLTALSPDEVRTAVTAALAGRS